MRGRVVILSLEIKTEMIKLGEEGALRARIGLNPGLLCQTVGQVVNAKERFLKEI